MSIGGIGGYLTQTGTVMRSTRTQAVTGAVINAWSSQAEVMGRLRPFTVSKAGGESLSADKLTVFAGFRWYCAPTAAMVEDDRLRVDGVTYRIAHIADVMSMGRLMQVDLELVGHDV
jgi:hypothetical protein